MRKAEIGDKIVLIPGANSPRINRRLEAGVYGEFVEVTDLIPGSPKEIVRFADPTASTGRAGVWNVPGKHFNFYNEKEMSMANKKESLKCWEDAEAILKSGARRVLLFGIPGTGKTYAARHAGIEKSKKSKDRRKVYNLYIQPETPAIDVLGHDIIRDGDMIWRDGPAIRAWRQGARLVINEIDKASEDCLDALLAICDDPESAGFELPSGEYVEPSPGFQVVATMNGEREDLPDALQDRFAIGVEITHPHPHAIAALSEDIRDLAANSSHAGVAEERRISIRQFRGFEELRELGLPDDQAARATFRHRAGDVLVALSTARLKSTAPREKDEALEDFEA